MPPPKTRQVLEFEIVYSLVRDPKLFQEYALESEYFSTGIARKIFDRIKQLASAGKKIDLVTVAEGLTVREMEPFFIDLKLGIQTYLDFISACNQLKEFYWRQRIEDKIKECGDSTEFLEFVKNNTDIMETARAAKLQHDWAEFGDFISRRNNQDVSSPVSGWPKFDDLARFERGNLVIVGARPSIGKSAFCLDYALRAADLNSRVLFISLEMSKPQIFYRILSKLNRVNSKIYRTAQFDFQQAEDTMTKLFAYDKLRLAFSPRLTSFDLRQFQGFDLIIVDYLQLLNDKPDRGENETARLTKITRNLKLLAGENNCVVMAAAQLNRDAEKGNREPGLADLRGSGSLEQDADVAILLHRESRESLEVKAIIAKNRAGEVGEVVFDYAPQFNLFMELG